MSLTPEQQRQNLKQEYGWLYEASIQLLAEYDPMHLIAMGAPRDEYEPEVDVILLRLPEASSPSTLGQIIYEAFVHCFGSTFSLLPYQSSSERTKTRFAAMGEKAWASWRQWKAVEQ
jgi:hypothetical protein